MAAAVKLRTDDSAWDLRRLAALSKHANQSWRLLSLAAVLDGLCDIRSKGHPPRLTAAQLAELAAIVEAGPDRAVHGVVRWRRVDLRHVVLERFGVDYHERTVGKILKALGVSHISARPRHPGQDPNVMEEFKTYGPPRSQGVSRDGRLIQSASTYPASEACLPAKMEIRALGSS